MSLHIFLSFFDVRSAFFGIQEVEIPLQKNEILSFRYYMPRQYPFNSTFYGILFSHVFISFSMDDSFSTQCGIIVLWGIKKSWEFQECSNNTNPFLSKKRISIKTILLNWHNWKFQTTNDRWCNYLWLEFQTAIRIYMCPIFHSHRNRQEVNTTLKQI